MLVRLIVKQTCHYPNERECALVIQTREVSVCVVVALSWASGRGPQAVRIRELTPLGTLPLPDTGNCRLLNPT